MGQTCYRPLPPSNGDGIDDVKRSSSALPPTHYTLEIDSFSDLQKMLKETGQKSYESQTFEACGYKWKLSLYPYGDQERNGKGHISMYLVIAETDDLPSGWEVYANFEFFIYDKIHDKFLKVQDAKKRASHFNSMKTEWGFAKLISQSDFHDTNNGHLIHDKCVFGAQIYVNRKGERLTPMKKSSSSYASFRIDRFSSLNQEIFNSPIFTLGGLKWRLKIYSEGVSTDAGKYLSLFLLLEQSKATQRVYADFKFTIRNQQSDKSRSNAANHWFTAASNSWGWSQFISISDIKDKSKGFLEEDTLIMHVQVMNLLELQSFS